MKNKVLPERFYVVLQNDGFGKQSTAQLNKKALFSDMRMRKCQLSRHFEEMKTSKEQIYQENRVTISIQNYIKDPRIILL